MLTALLSKICRSQPDQDAWGMIEALARREHGARAESFLAAQVCQTLATLEEGERKDSLPAVAEVIARSAQGPQLALLLASSSERTARQLALSIVARSSGPFDPRLLAALKPLLAYKRAPAGMQIAAAGALLKVPGIDGPSANEVLSALISRAGKARSMARLRRLEQRIGNTPLLSQRFTEIENRMRMRCPRCHLQLRRPKMAIHLWRYHGLLLDGRRVRRPWRMIEEWIGEYRRWAKPEVLARCRAVAQHLDAKHGLLRVERLLLKKGFADTEEHQSFLTEAKRCQATLCPHCYALVPIHQEGPLPALNQSRGRFSLAGYCVEVSERGLVPQLSIESPRAVIYRGPEPNNWLTPTGALLLLVGPFVLIALALALFLPCAAISSRGPVVLTLSMAMAVYVVVRTHWWSQPQPIDRAVDHAWTRLVPHVLLMDLSAHSSAFLAGLAMASMSHGSSKVRAEFLPMALENVEGGIAAGTFPLGHLVLLRRLEANDAAVLGKDPVSLVAMQAGRSLEGELPLAFAERLLASWETNWWTTGNLARLRVRLCERAFEAGLEVRDLLEVGQTAPALGDVLDIHQPQRLAQLRLLWSLRPSQPWHHWGEAITVFELGADPEAGARLLGKYPDLLLVDRGLPPVYLCGRGIVLCEVLITEQPRRVEIKTKRDFDGVEYELCLDERRLRFVDDPGFLVGRLQRWFHHYFEEFLPALAGVESWQPPPGTKPAQFQETAACPECRRSLVTRIGEVGLRLDSHH